MTPVSVTTEYLANDAGYADLARRIGGPAAAMPGSVADGSTWVRRLPSLLESLLGDWQLAPDGATSAGQASIVVPVTREDQPLALRVSLPLRDPPRDHLALRAWDGRGAVRLIAADPARRAVLLERLDATSDLERVPIDDACEIVGGLLARLAVPAPATIPAIADVHRARIDGLRRGSAGLPRRVTLRAAALFDELTHPARPARLLHGDLHFGHVLGGTREPWLAISPTPTAGPPEADLAPVLRHRVAAYGSGSAFRWTVRRRVEIVADAAGLDEDLARLWCIVHASLDAAAAAEDGRTDATTFHLALIKALEE